MKNLVMEAAERAARYLEGLKDRSVAPPREALERLEGFDLPLQPEPIAAEAVLAELDELGSAATVASAPGRVISASSRAARCRRPWPPTSLPAPGIRTPSSMSPRRRRPSLKTSAGGGSLRCSGYRRMPASAL